MASSSMSPMSQNPQKHHIPPQISRMAQLPNNVKDNCFYSDDFATFSETCFQEFGDRVNHWMTFNEPHTFSIQGYDLGHEAPGRCSILSYLYCKAENSATEPYVAGHNVLLAHGTATYIYREMYKSFACIKMPKERRDCATSRSRTSSFPCGSSPYFGKIPRQSLRNLVGK
ncbi:hypothetical protein AgCh_022129 [Apium graveolens]